MESAEAEVVYTFHTRVVDIQYRKRVIRSFKRGDETFTEEENLGWFVLLHGSHESLFIGFEKPIFAIGDAIEVRIRKRNANG